MRFSVTSSLLAISLVLSSGCAARVEQPAPLAAAPAEAVPAAALSGQPAPLADLVGTVALPYEKFTLDNGLTVLVNEDRKAPVVAVGVWYNVGSKDEPRGKTGFAHLFEHLMFYGSDNLREGIMGWLEKIGATDWNGSTWYDRTNYYQTVPKSALEQVLFMESDRMGYLLPAIDQKRLDLQRGVVQNEKRQRDNAPGGLVGYAVSEALLPPGHPYRHSTIGSMADLDAASLADVKQWFIDKYGPNNAVLVLSGDIDVAEARRLANKYFGAIPRGAVNVPAAADVPTLEAPKRLVLKDRVAATSIQRYWVVPGLASDELAALDVGASVLGGLASSRLDKILVRDEKIAVSVSARYQPFQRLGNFTVTATVKPGVDPALVEKRLDEIVADYLANGPTDEEIKRAATVEVAQRIRSLEKTGDDGKIEKLAEGYLYNNDPLFFRRVLAGYAALTPDSVRSSLQRWLGRPALTVHLEPGERPPYEEAKGPRRSTAKEDLRVASVKREMPPAGPAPALDFPDIQRATLSNGIPVAYAQRTASPVTQLALSFDAGFAADPADRRGIQNMMLELLDEGAAGRTSQQIAEEKEKLGAALVAAGSADRSIVTLSALSANLAPSLGLMRDIVLSPDFNQPEVERVRGQLLTAVAQAKKNPGSIAQRTLPPLLFGAGHPYATTALGDEAAIQAIARDDLIAFKERWIRPEKAKLFVVSDRPLSEIVPMLEAAFGRWQAPAAAAGAKDFGVAVPSSNGSRIVLVDRPDSPQSIIYAGQITPIVPTGDIIPINAATDVFGGTTASRLSMDLREAKGWSYGAYGGLQMRDQSVPYLIQAPVQADRTGESLAAVRKMLGDISGAKGVTPAELAQAVSNNVDGLPGQFETSGAVLAAMLTLDQFKRPDNYYELLGTKYRSLTPAQADAAFRAAIHPDRFVYVVVGDAKKVRRQLDKLGLPVEVVEAK
jgi:zinc protease